MLIAVDGGLLPEANEGGRRPATGLATTTGSMLSVCWGKNADACRRAAFALVPGDEDHATLLVGGGIENHWHVGGQPGVAVGDGAIVHVVGEVRRDEVVAGDRVVSQVGGQFREGSDVCDAVRRSGAQ